NEAVNLALANIHRRPGLRVWSGNRKNGPHNASVSVRWGADPAFAAEAADWAASAAARGPSEGSRQALSSVPGGCLTGSAWRLGLGGGRSLGLLAGGALPVRRR